MFNSPIFIFYYYKANLSFPRIYNFIRDIIEYTKIP